MADAGRMRGPMRWAGGLLAMLVCLTAALAGPVRAAPSAATEHVSLTLIPEWRSVPAGGGTFRVVLEQEIIPGWHTYWLNPGDSGEPTEAVWALPGGVTASGLAFPYPHRKPYGPLVNFGYEGTVRFVAEMTVPPGQVPGTDLTFAADVYWLVCEEICIPEQVEVDFTLPVAEGAADIAPDIDPDGAAALAAALDTMPQPVPWTATYEVSEGQVTVGVAAPETVPAFESGRVREVVFFPEPDGIIANAAPQTVRFGADGFALATDAGWRAEDLTDPLALVIVIVDEADGSPIERAVRLEALPGAVPAGMIAAPLAPSSMGTGSGTDGGGLPAIGIAQALLFALIGGLILNVMPCVFPVLFMKAFGFVEAARKDAGAVRLHGIAFMLGVVLSFAAVGGALIALRTTGAQIGWGFQLQDPLFITGLIYLLLLVGLNLSGVFEIGQSLIGVGSQTQTGRGTVGAFMTGVLAAVVATPCVAPFMGAAIGFGLSQPAPIALGVFVALGFGMALPWVLLAFFPPLLRLLPRPGAWMDMAKKLLAFPVYATAAWLLWVLTQQIGPASLAAALAGAVLTGFAAWAWGMSQGARHPLIGAGVAAVAFALAVAASLIVIKPDAAPLSAASASAPAGPGAGPAASADFEAFTPARLASLRDAGTPVLLNATAAWCITCLVNEQVALSQPEVVARLEAADIVYMKADWTRRDPDITRLLDGFGRSGVPLYVLYPANGGDPVVLPQVLTPRIVLDAIDGAIGPVIGG